MKFPCFPDILIAVCRHIFLGAVALLVFDVGLAQAAPLPAETDAAEVLPAVEVVTPDAGEVGSFEIASLRPREAVPRRATYSSVSTEHRIVALTFDDGPHETLTPKLLQILRAERVPATFFVIGKKVEAAPGIARRIVAEGHEIANHSWTHPVLSKMGDKAVERELSRTSALIRKVTGAEVGLFRPPYGAFSTRQKNWTFETMGMSSIMWSVDPQDWKYRDSAAVRRKLVAGAHPGAILLAHDIHATTVAAMPGTIRDLKAAGYRFATVSQLLSLDKPRPVATVAVPEDTAASTAPNDP